MRFEIEIVSKNIAQTNASQFKDEAQINSADELHLSLYDEADPNYLFLTRIDYETFKKIQQR